MTRLITLLAALLLLSGCNLIRPGSADCSKPRAYESAREAPLLKVPEGADQPQTRNALKIPKVDRPTPPRSGCLDQPPEYRPATTAG